MNIPDQPPVIPPSLRRGHVTRIHNAGCLEVSLHLGFGVDILKFLVLEGFNSSDIPPGRRKEALHCLVIIAGGKDIIAKLDDGKADGYVTARVYLVDPPPSHLDHSLALPAGLDRPHVDVAELYRWAATKGYDAGAVRDALRKRGP